MAFFCFFWKMRQDICIIQEVFKQNFIIGFPIRIAVSIGRQNIVFRNTRRGWSPARQNPLYLLSKNLRRAYSMTYLNLRQAVKTIGSPNALSIRWQL
jgi:hypothetical protein